jgi:hypothetical protein
MREVGITKASPHKFASQGADWRFLKQLKTELKV